MAGAVIVVALLLCWPATLTLRDVRFRLGDSRGGARRWVEHHVPDGSTVLVDNYAPWIDDERYDVRGARHLLRPELVEDAEPAAVVVTRKGRRAGFSGPRRAATVAAIERLDGRACETATFGRGLERIWVFRLQC
jgi:hypothetical protein